MSRQGAQLDIPVNPSFSLLTYKNVGKTGVFIVKKRKTDVETGKRRQTIYGYH